MKRLIIILIIATMLLSGCSIGLMGMQPGTRSNDVHTFTEMDEIQHKHLVIPEALTLEVAATGKIEEGKIHVRLLDENKVYFEAGGDGFSESRQLELEAGTYTVEVTYEQARDGRLELNLSSKDHFEFKETGEEKNK